MNYAIKVLQVYEPIFTMDLTIRQQYQTGRKVSVVSDISEKGIKNMRIYFLEGDILHQCLVALMLPHS